MNNLELERRLKDFPVRVTCADELPISIGKKPRTYVVNTDPCSLPGSHWTVFHFPRLGPPEFFNSMGERAKTYNLRFEYVLANNGPGMSSSLYSLLSSYEFQHFSIVFLQLFYAEVFQDVAERTVSISTEIGNRVFLPDDSGLRHHLYVDRQPIATEREKRTVDHLTQQCHRIRPTQSHVESGQTIREEEGASRFES
jgi:hypothetical protein